MPFFSATAKNNHDLAHGLAQFTGLTQIKTLFYSFTGVLIQDDTVATDVTTNQHQLTTLSLTTTALFPVGIDHCLWGVILCDTTNVSAQQLRFARTYLIDTLRQVFAEHANDTIQVWAALDSTQLNQISHFYQLLVHANAATTTKSSLVPLNTPLINDDAYRSMNQALHFIHDHIHQSLSLDEVAKVAYLSPSYLSRLFKRYLQTNFVSYVNTPKI
ncbi:helix-turn-helix domain-containing protein, partial [Levilactobacillus brevis]